MRVWITKYALTTGIEEAEAEVCADINVNMIAVKGRFGHTCYHKPDWHESEPAAKSCAEAMRVFKIASHRKSIAKLEAMRFV